MGNKPASALGFEDLTNISVENDLDIKIIDDELASLFKFKILLLGTGESGKSTILKQLKLMHKKKITMRETTICGDGIHQSIISCMQSLCIARRQFAMYELDEDGKQTESEVDEWDNENGAGGNNQAGAAGGGGQRISVEFGARIKRLFETEAIQKTYARRSEFWILDGCQWYMQNIERVTDPNWTPSEDDCMMARVRTTGIIVTDLEDKSALEEKDKMAPGAAAPTPSAGSGLELEAIGKGKGSDAAALANVPLGPERIIYQIVDVGGQRNERKKWIHCFDDVKAIMFVDNLAGFNAVMFEDNLKNRMVESLELFNKVTYLPQFKDTPVFLTLNKRDLFESMIKETDLRETFKEYKGGKDYRNAMEFITSSFQKQAPPKKDIHAEAISARYTREVRLAFEKVKDTVYGANKEKLMEQFVDLHQRKQARVTQINKAKEPTCGCLPASNAAPVRAS